MVFWMCVPFAQIADGSLTRPPSSQSNDFVTKWHSLEKVVESLVPYCRNRCLFDKHVGSMNRTKQQSASLAVVVAPN